MVMEKNLIGAVLKGIEPGDLDAGIIPQLILEKDGVTYSISTLGELRFSVLQVKEAKVAVSEPDVFSKEQQEFIERAVRAAGFDFIFRNPKAYEKKDSRYRISFQGCRIDDNFRQKFKRAVSLLSEYIVSSNIPAVLVPGFNGELDIYHKDAKIACASTGTRIDYAVDSTDMVLTAAEYAATFPNRITI